MSMIYAAKDPAVTQRERDHAALSREMAEECMVLLENDRTLPLAAAGNLALYGNGARRTVRGGTGSGDVNVRSSVSIEQGLENAGFTVTTKAWLDRQDNLAEAAEQAYLRWVPEFARKEGISEQHVMFTHPLPVAAPAEITDEDITGARTDTAVYVISRISGEGSDRHCVRGDYLLYEEERSQLEQLGRAYNSLILVLNIGGVMDLSEVKAIPGVNAVLLMSQLGSAGGSALANVLTGKVTPSGKLTDTWAKRYGDYPASATFSHNDGNVDDEYYTEGIYVGYRYFDTFGIEPLYPFGYGMSYTDFAISFEGIKIEGETVRLSASVVNTGVCAGKEVVQVYYSAPAGTKPKPYQELLCFRKTKLLAPGETETMELVFSARKMAFYCEDCAAWMLEAGEYVLRMGSHSRGTQPVTVLSLDRTVKTEVLRNLFADPEPVHEIEAPLCACAAVDASVPRFALCADAIQTRYAVYQERREELTSDKTEHLTAADVKAGKCTVEDLTAQLTVEEMAQLCVGTLRMDGGSVIGNASAAVPGAAGDTSMVIAASRGIKGLILADGPAGLRLQPVFHTDRNGVPIPEDITLNPITGHSEQQEDGARGGTYYQYCTAIPIGWALAQSWNLPMLEEIGSMVGAEMELFGVDLWLAPALNIHRDPLCGRNFEYYSEDPLVSGKAAAAITSGVQRHKGKGTTLKHFAANSQEDNRCFTNSHICERALREIYLAGFEIAVKESQPMSIMTSYNLLNGIHTANHRDLIQSVARDEWGFQGIVMTDWFTSQDQTAMIGNVHTRYPISASTGCIFSGNDIQMPGCKKNMDDIVDAVHMGREIDGYHITLADLQQCAANIIRTVAAAMN